MQRLPALVAGSTRQMLPMADGSAATLMEVLLSEKMATARHALAETLAGDPPLTLWTVAMAARDGARLGDAQETADWLAEHVLTSLQGNSDGDASGSGDASESAAAWGERVAAAIEMAELAATLARSEEPTAADRAFLAGLMGVAAAWLPDGVVVPLDFSTNRWAIRAMETLRNAAPGDALSDMVDSCRRRAAEMSRRWLQSGPSIVGLLPELVTRLARLHCLETRFDQTLEAEKLEAMAEFAAGAGHEINNPLAVIAGRAQLFLQDEEDPERRRGLALINAQAKRVYEMIADMMLFARPPAPAFEPTELVALVDRVIGELASQSSRQGTVIARSGHAGPLEIEADATQLTVALRAMCRNAIEAIGHDGHVEIGLVEAGDHVEIRVTDDGPGIGDDARRHLFDPYYSARQAGRGLGLGLSKCWRIIVTNHDGRIDVESRERQTVFTIMLSKRQKKNSAR